MHNNTETSVFDCQPIYMFHIVWAVWKLRNVMVKLFAFIFSFCSVHFKDNWLVCLCKREPFIYQSWLFVCNQSFPSSPKLVFRSILLHLSRKSNNMLKDQIKVREPNREIDYIILDRKFQMLMCSTSSNKFVIVQVRRLLLY